MKLAIVSWLDKIVDGVICYLISRDYGVAAGFFCFAVLLTLNQILYTLLGRTVTVTFGEKP